MKSASLPMTLKTNELTLFGIKFKQKVSKPRIGRLLVFIFSLLTFWACPKPEPIIEPPRDTTIHLELIDTWTTSVTLKISVEDTTEAWNFALSRNGSIVHEGFVDKADTVLVDEGLGVATDYSYSAYFIENANIKDSSLTITTTTMDTTSHDFTWTIDTLGTYGGRLNDVHIVNEDDIWVVGQIIMDDPDSSWNGTGTETFNAAHWDGIEWEMIKISNGTAEAKAIHYFSEDDIWSTYGGYPAYWDGNEWKWYHLHSMGIDAGIITSIWGTSSDNMYFVGYNGGIVHYDGSEFVKINCDVDTDFIDVVGTPDGEHVFIVGNPAGRIGGEMLLQMNGNTLEWQKVQFPFKSTATPNFWSVDLCNNEIFIPVLFEGIWTFNYDNNNSNLDRNIPRLDRLYKSTKVVAENDIMFCGSKMDYIHFNGMTYKYVSDDGVYDPNFRMRGGDYNGEVVVMVGETFSSSRAIITRGQR